MAARNAKKSAKGFKPICSLYTKNRESPRIEIIQYGKASFRNAKYAFGLLYNVWVWSFKEGQLCQMIK